MPFSQKIEVKPSIWLIQHFRYKNCFKSLIQTRVLKEYVAKINLVFKKDLIFLTRLVSLKRALVSLEQISNLGRTTSS